MDKATKQHRVNQTEQLVELFRQRPVMNTKEARMACYAVGIMNFTARKSDAEAEGYEWEVTPIKGTLMSLFKFKGLRVSNQMQLFKAA